MATSYNDCCRRNAAEHPGFNLCPECERVLVRCESCGRLCAPDDFCESCHVLSCHVDVGQRFREGESLALGLRLANQGERVGRLVGARYGLNCGAEYTHSKPIDRSLAPGELQDVVIDGLLLERAGIFSLCFELSLAFDEKVFAFVGETTARAESAQPRVESVKVEFNDVVNAQASDNLVNIHIGSGPASGDDSQVMKEVALIPRTLSPGGVNRETAIVIHHGEPRAPRTYYLAAKPTLTLGVAKPEKYPRNDVNIRLYPEREGLNLECNNLMSRAHLSLRAVQGELCLFDLSSNGTSVNGKRVPPNKAFPLHEGDRVATWLDPRLVRHRSWRLRFHKLGERVETVEWIPLGN